MKMTSFMSVSTLHMFTQYREREEAFTKRLCPATTIRSRKIWDLLQSTTEPTSLEVLELHEKVNYIIHNLRTHAELRKKAYGD